MNLNSTIFHIEVAKLGKGFIVKSSVCHVPANGGTTTNYSNEGGDLYFKDQHEFAAWMALLADTVR